MKSYIMLISLVLLACGGISVFSSDTNDAPDPEVLKHYLELCQAGCQQLEKLTEEVDGKSPCLQARDHEGMDCVEYCVHKMQVDSNTDPECWKELKACDDFEEQCHFGELY